MSTIWGLKIVLTKEWRALPWAEIRKSVNSLERRLELCRELEANGYHIDWFLSFLRLFVVCERV